MKKSFILVLLSLYTAFSVHAQVSPDIRLNQVGFYPDGEKLVAVTTSASKAFSIKSVIDDSEVFSGTLNAPKFWNLSDENVAIADFSSLEIPGNYYIEVDGIGKSYDFIISDRVHLNTARASAKAFYFNRASTALTEEFAWKWSRASGHPDNEVLIHASAATALRPENTKISSPKGWYDAGDYNKYIVNSGISTYTLLHAYEQFPELYKNLNLHIPESNNELPDLLDEVMWNLEWMLTMQDPNDGGVYHKLTNANFDGEVMPASATSTRYVVQKSTAATLNFAAVMAHSYRVYKPFLPDFAEKCLNAAKEAYVWAKANNEVYYVQNSMNNAYNPDIYTGEYGDNNVSDEFNWAAIELYISTLEDAYYSDHTLNFSGGFWMPGWNYVNPLAIYSLSFNRENLTVIAQADLENIDLAITKTADDLLAKKKSAPYQFSNDQFYWGSNSLVANQGITLLLAYKISLNTEYLDAANASLDYLLGRNPTGYSYVTGIGSKPSMNIHHRQSQADGIDDPVPGFLAGGPNPGQEDKCPGYISSKPAKSYVDSWCSYASNEIAINWNAPLVFISGGLENYFEKENFQNLNSPPTTPLVLTAEAKGMDIIELEWQNGTILANEIIIERSMNDEQAFQQVSEVTGNTTFFADEQLTAATTYFYRLKATNPFGTSEYSNILSATTEEAVATGIERSTDGDINDYTLFPNPTKGSMTLKLVSTNAAHLPLKLTIFDSQGRKIKNQILTISGAEYSTKLGVTRGLYIVYLEQGNEKFAPKKIVVE